RVIAYGTKFNVNAYDDEPFIEAVLEKGKIDVIRNDERIRLEPNKQVVLNKESGVFRVSAVNLDEKMDWRKGRMVFRNTPLEKVLKRLEKRYNVEIVLHKNSNAEYKYRATFTNETLEQILDYLKQTAPIEWSARQLSSHSDSTFVRQRIDVYQR
ncbi:FecR family protein, partial [Parabacteroides distasonis]